MQRLKTKLKDQEVERFDARVAAAFRSAGMQATVRVNKVGGQRIGPRGHDIGDVDVMAVDGARRPIIAAETKALAPARTLREQGKHLDTLFRLPGGKRSGVEKHLVRVRWLRDNLGAVLADFGLAGEDPTTWTVEPLLVLDFESASPYLAAPPFPVVGFERVLAEWGLADGG